jgi:nitrogen fixation protein NifU and related proteins
MRTNAVSDDRTSETGDDWVGKLQDKVIRDMEKAYSPRVMELWKNPQNAGSLDYPDGYGQVTGPCGDTMQIWLRVANDEIVDATFWTDGCGTSVVCASMVTIMAKGKTLEQAVRIDQQSVLSELGGLPEEDRHCALLAANTLREAIGCVRPRLAGDEA